MRNSVGFMIGAALLVALAGAACRETDPDSTTTDWLSYDDGGNEGAMSAPWGPSAGGMLAVRFTPPAYPATVLAIRFYIVGACGHPETTFGVRVFDDDGTDGYPGADLLSEPLEGAGPVAGGFVEIPLGAQAVVVSDGEFYAGMEWLTAPGSQGEDAQCLGADDNEPDTRSYWRGAAVGAQWQPIEVFGSGGDRDVMIRAFVETPLE